MKLLTSRWSAFCAVIYVLCLSAAHGTTVFDSKGRQVQPLRKGRNAVHMQMPNHPMFQHGRSENLSSESVTQSEEAPPVNVMTAKDARTTSASPKDKVTVPIYFSIAGIAKVEDVTVCGSWSSWMDHYKLGKSGDDFDGVIDLPVGKHQFKFIIDGNWTTSSQWPITYDKDGQANNVIDVAAPRYANGVPLRKFHNEIPEEVEPTPAEPAAAAVAPKRGVGLKDVVLFPLRAVGAMLSLVLSPLNFVAWMLLRQ